MSSMPFDTHAAVKRLSAAGFSEAQAEALVATWASERGDLATKADLRLEIGALRQETNALEIRLIKWMVGLILPLYAIQIGILLALLLQP